MSIISQYISIITINVIKFNPPIKRYRLAEWVRKQTPAIYCTQETLLTHKETHSLKVKGWKTILHAPGLQKEGGVAILFADTLNFKPSLVKKIKKSTICWLGEKLMMER